MSSLSNLFVVGSEVVVINPNLVQRNRVGIIEQVLDNAIIIKIGNAHYALQPNDLKFTDKDLQSRFEEELTLKEANEREILESQLLKQAGVFDVEAIVEEPVVEEPVVEEPVVEELPITKVPNFKNF